MNVLSIIAFIYVMFMYLPLVIVGITAFILDLLRVANVSTKTSHILCAVICLVLWYRIIKNITIYEDKRHYKGIAFVCMYIAFNMWVIRNLYRANAEIDAVNRLAIEEQQFLAEQRRKREEREQILHENTELLQFIMNGTPDNLREYLNKTFVNGGVDYRILYYIPIDSYDTKHTIIPNPIKRFIIDYIQDDGIRTLLSEVSRITERNAALQLTNAHESGSSALIECISKALRTYQKTPFPYDLTKLNEIAADIEKVTREMGDDFYISSSQFMECTRNKFVDATLGDIPYYGYGNRWTVSEYQNLPHIQKISLCEIWARVWEVIMSETEKDSEERKILIGDFKGKLEDLLNEGVCSAGWARAASLVLKQMGNESKVKTGINVCYGDATILEADMLKTLKDGVNTYFDTVVEDMEYDEIEEKYYKSNLASFNAYKKDILDTYKPKAFREVFKKYYPYALDAKRDDGVNKGIKRDTIENALSSFVIAFEKAYDGLISSERDKLYPPQERKKEISLPTPPSSKSNIWWIIGGIIVIVVLLVKSKKWYLK